MGRFFLGTWPQNSPKILSRRPSSNSAQNFGQIPSPALCLTFSWNFTSRKLRRVLKKIQGRQTGRQQTLAFRYRRRSPPELGYRGECPTYRPLPMLSLRLSIWGGSVLRDVAVCKTAYRCQVHTPFNKKCTVQQ